MPDQDEDEVKTEVKEEDSGAEPASDLPRDDELKQSLFSILATANLEELTKRAARRLLETKLGRWPCNIASDQHTHSIIFWEILL
jgi:hypothetical protein